MQAALNETLKAGGVVYFPAGRYRLSKPLFANASNIGERGMAGRRAGMVDQPASSVLHPQKGSHPSTPTRAHVCFVVFRGAGQAATRLVFTRPLADVYGVQYGVDPCTGEGRGSRGGQGQPRMTAGTLGSALLLPQLERLLPGVVFVTLVQASCSIFGKAEPLSRLSELLASVCLSVCAGPLACLAHPPAHQAAQLHMHAPRLASSGSLKRPPRRQLATVASGASVSPGDTRLPVSMCAAGRLLLCGTGLNVAAQYASWSTCLLAGRSCMAVVIAEGCQNCLPCPACLPCLQLSRSAPPPTSPWANGWN